MNQLIVKMNTSFKLKELHFAVPLRLWKKNISVFATVEHFAFKRWQQWESNENWQPLQHKYKKNILGTASHGTRLFLESTKNIWKKNSFPEKLKAGLLRRNSVGPGIQQDRLPHFERTVYTRRIYLEPTGTDAIRYRSGKFPEHRGRNPKNKCGRSQIDPHPEVGSPVYQSSHSVDSKPD